MKQHIVIEQLKELDSHDFIVLYKKTRTETDASLRQIYNIYSKLHKSEFFGFNKLLSEINIGKMIEMLENECNSVKIRQDGRQWVVGAWIGHNKCFDEYSENLNDALWESVKFILMEKDRG